MVPHGKRKGKRIGNAIVPLLCFIWVVSLVATVEHEQQGVHSAQDSRRAVLADCDVDNLQGNDLPITCSGSGFELPDGSHCVAAQQFVWTIPWFPLCPVSGYRPASTTGTISPTVLRL